MVTTMIIHLNCLQNLRQNWIGSEEFIAELSMTINLMSHVKYEFDIQEGENVEELARRSIG